MEREREGEEGREREVRGEHNITDMTHDLESSSLNSKNTGKACTIGQAASQSSILCDFK